MEGPFLFFPPFFGRRGIWRRQLEDLAAAWYNNPGKKAVRRRLTTGVGRLSVIKLGLFPLDTPARRRRRSSPDDQGKFRAITTLRNSRLGSVGVSPFPLILQYGAPGTSTSIRH